MIRGLEMQAKWEYKIWVACVFVCVVPVDISSPMGNHCSHIAGQRATEQLWTGTRQGYCRDHEEDWQETQSAGCSSVVPEGSRALQWSSESWCICSRNRAFVRSFYWIACLHHFVCWVRVHVLRPDDSTGGRLLFIQREKHLLFSLSLNLTRSKLCTALGEQPEERVL